VQSSLDDAETQQRDALDALDAATEAEAERLSSALTPLGIDIEPVEDGPKGGPFVPADGMHFVERAALLERDLAQLAALRRTAAALPLEMPVRASAVSSGFGYRNDPFLGRRALHAGLDFVAPTGTDVRATAPGVVVSAGWSGGYGKMVEIRHANGVSTRYGHLSAVLVERGENVAAGAAIGRVGSTGRSTGPHLHYETRRNGEPVNPAAYLAAGKAL
jgi:murein DD-endopeptidase MepM/ murein hydrolase activator NlpD